MDLKETYNRIAEDWHKDHQEDTWAKDGTDQFMSMLPPGGLVLDAGCGGGLNSKYLQDHGFKVVGTDLSDKMVEIAKREMPDAEFHVMDVREPGFEGRFDGVFVKAVLLHVPKAELNATLENLKKKLKPGGLLYVSVKERREGQVEEGVTVENDYGYEYSRFFSYYTMDELTAAASAIGMKVESTSVLPVNNTRWLTMIARG